MWRHHPRTKLAKKMVESGEIGELRLITASFGFDIDRNDSAPSNPNVAAALACGRRLLRRELRPALHRRRADPRLRGAHWWPTGVDMTMQISLAFPGDVLANIDCSFETPYRCRARARRDQGADRPRRSLPPPAGTPLLYTTATHWAGKLDSIEIPEANEFGEEIDDFCRSIEAGKLVGPGEDGVANMRAAEWILETAKMQPK